MKKYIVLIILAVTMVFAPSPVRAQDEISLLDSTVGVQFPLALTFGIKAESANDITKIRLHYRVDKMNYAKVISEAWPVFVPSPHVETNWTLDMRKTKLPPGATIHYWWTIEDESGKELVIPEDSIRFNDDRYPWQSLTLGLLTFHWYEGDRALINELILASEQALERLAGDTGVYLETPVDIYVYANSRDLQGAMVFPNEWTGGVAFTEFGIIAIGISQQNLDWGKDAMAHELGHMVTHRLTFSPYGASLPTWIDEGLAMHAESQPDPFLQSWLKKAAADDRLISVRSLSSPFSAKSEEAYISYAESRSIIEFLVQNYGKNKVFQLLTLFKEGNTSDEALTEIYNFDQERLDQLWREWLETNLQSRLRDQRLTDIICSRSLLSMLNSLMFAPSFAQ